MKKLLLAVSATILIFGMDNIAAANPTESLCRLSAQMLQAHGFTEGAIYTGQDLNNLLQKIRVKTPESFNASENYRATYRCEADPTGTVAHATLRAVSITHNAWRTIQWTFTH